MNLLQAELLKAEIKPKGKPAMVDTVKVAGKTFAIRGKVLKTASLNREWQYDVDNPEEVIRVLKDSDMQIDLLKFWQRVPETEPKYQYYREWRQVAAIPITDFKHWWDKQVNCKTRNMVRKSQKLGVIIKQIELDDEFVRGVVDIYSQSPLRRGKPFGHYGKGFATVKRELSDAGGEAVYVAAYYNKELIGFIQFLVADRYAMITMILDKTTHRNKAPMNAMVAKVVEICADRQIPYLTYTVWRRGEHGQFQKHNGFTKIPVPEYYVPITLRGRLALLLRLHEGLQSVLPENVIVWLLRMRTKWYSFRYPSRESGCNVAAV
ncbi:MAG TPA: hypothetical protein VN966_05765 [Candidatus Bathyarchaeia archaeon]|nr:hypothetical protein [Candidatus Bathyarchaeia archaeon]